MSKFFTADDVAKMLHAERKTINSMCAAGEFRGAKKVGRGWIIPDWSVEEYFRRDADIPRTSEGNAPSSDLGGGETEGMDRQGREEGRGSVRSKKASGARSRNSLKEDRARALRVL